MGMVMFGDLVLGFSLFGGLVCMVEVCLALNREPDDPVSPARSVGSDIHSQ
ncbi:MAG: hypothetical protein JO316_05280 [Abitibacteriaceae bacterium]|nr:hypothetical protein [Abditibacteriaceae bacterium]MBV9864738.1 hypothetical protein [Abditibacteriaceae bacterium]